MEIISLTGLTGYFQNPRNFKFPSISKKGGCPVNYFLRVRINSDFNDYTNLYRWYSIGVSK